MAKGKAKKGLVKKTIKKTKRSSKRYPALDITVNLKTRTELLDFDYISKLNDKEKEWLNKFVEETIHASFPKKKRHLTKTKEQRKKIYDSNNARNRCIYTKSKAQGKLDYIEDLRLMVDEENDLITTEEQLIEEIDRNSLDKELTNFYKPGSDTDDEGNKA